MNNNHNGRSTVSIDHSHYAMACDLSIIDILELAPCAVFTFYLTGEQSAVIPFASNKFMDILGLEPEDVAGNAEPFLCRISRQDIARFFASASASLLSMQAWSIEFLFEHDRKGKIWIEWQAAPVKKDNVVVWNGVVLDITQRKTMQQEKELFECTLNSLADSVYLVNDELCFEYVNDTACQTLGCQREELLGMGPMDIDPEAEQDVLSEIYQRSLAGESFTFEGWHRSNEGGSFPVEFTIACVEFAGRRINMCIARNISERKRILQELQRSNREFHSLAENLPDNVARWDSQGRYLYLNPQLEKALHVNRDEVIGKLAREVFPFSFSEVHNSVSKIVETGELVHIQHLSVPDDNGAARLHDLKLIPELDDDGNVATILGIGRDMTDHYSNIEELAAWKSELMRLQCAVNASADSIFIIDKNYRFVTVNNTACRKLGYSSEELLGMSPLDIDPCITQDKMEQIAESTVDGVTEQFTTCHQAKDGTIFPVEIISTEFNDGVGNYAVSIARDISERIQIDEKLRMAASVFEAAREGITITDHKGIILDVNPAFTNITGYSADEVIGKNPRILSSGEHNAEFYETMWSELLSEGAWSGEITNRCKSGELYTELLNITAVHDGSGETKHYIGIFTDISLLKNQEKYLQHMAYHDVLTNLPNRLLLSSMLTNAINIARDTNSLLGVLYLDLDGFKPINDNYGHDTGDMVLVELSKRLSKQVRSTDTVARIGGDEFVVLLAGVPDAEECSRTASRLLDAVADPIVIGDTTVNLTMSIGICLHQGDCQGEADILLRHADQAMYLAKSSGRNQYVFYNSHISDDEIESTKTVHDLRQALKADQFSVYYQPIVDLENGKVVKAEALVRWKHPKLGMVPPSEFIPIAENVGLINEIGDLVFENAAQVAHALNVHQSMEFENKLQISINRSPRQFFHRDGVDRWIQYLEEQNIPGELLGVEITEGLLLDDWPDVLRQLNRMRDIGMSVSLDDFGTGYSALSYLTKFKIDYLKVDRSFINDIVFDKDYQAIVNSIIAMAKQLGIKTIGEGVETQKQEEILQNAGCDMVQGYLYAKPMPDDEFLEFVINNHAKVCSS